MNEDSSNNGVELYVERVERIQNSNIVLGVVWKYGKLFGSYYNISEKKIYTIMEIIDRPPHFLLMQSLLRELSPKHVITMGKLLDPFVGVLINVLNKNDFDPTVNSEWRDIPPNLTFLDVKEYSYVRCRHKLNNLHLETQPEHLDNANAINYLGSLVNLEASHTVHILGALIKFLEQSWRTMKTCDEDNLIFTHIKQLCLNDHVHIDSTTFNALNVFCETNHDSAFKYGGKASSREGMSLFRLLSQHCRSKMGTFKLREIMRSPINNIKELEKRYEFMDFIINPCHSTFFDSFVAALRKITNVDHILSKLQHSQGTAGQWTALYNTIFSLLQINEYIKPFLEKCQLFQQYADLVTDQLYMLESCLDSTLDFQGCEGGGRPKLKEGIDSQLDQSMAKYALIKNRLAAAAQTVCNHLPDFLEECTIHYIPDMGHVISFRKWAENCHPQDIFHYGFHYLFELNDAYHFKNALCQEMDQQIGDLPSNIQDHQNRIIQRIAKYVLTFNECIISPLQHIVFLDALISMAKVGCERNYTRPKFNTKNQINIENGRHPLLEVNNPNFVPNDFASGHPETLMKLLTGPNSSGKSIYLKQTAMLVYMAHIGSYVPASKANICPIHSIHSRLHACESAALNMSAFYIDLFQMGNALYNAKHSSLVVMDEFGRGTTGNVSKALLLAASRKFLSNEDLCPHVLISTHMTLEKEFLPSPLVLYQKMNHLRTAGTNSLTYLYKVTEGESSSCTFETLDGIFDDALLKRAKEIYDLLGGEQEVDAKYLKNIKIPSFDD